MALNASSNLRIILKFDNAYRKTLERQEDIGRYRKTLKHNYYVSMSSYISLTKLLYYANTNQSNIKM